MGRPKGSLNLKKKERLNKIEGMLLNHFNDHQIVVICRKEWSITADTAREYIRTVRKRWLEEEDERRPAKKAAARQRLLNIARISKNRPALLIQVERLLSEIEGTKAPEERHVEVKAANHDEALALAKEMLGIEEDENESST